MSWSRARRDIVVRWLPAAILMAAIFTMSSFRVPPLPQGPVVGVDKLIHAGVYGLLATLLYHATGRPVLAVVLTVAYGCTDELHQALVPGRFSDAFDALADAIGAVLGVASTWALLRARPGARTRDHGDHSKLQGNKPDDR